MPFQSVHCPIQVPPQYVEPYKHLDPNRQQFAGMLAALDEAVGQVQQGLVKKEMWQQTLTVFSSTLTVLFSSSAHRTVIASHAPHTAAAGGSG